MRIELLGTSFTPQHSDARVLDQIVYKWQHNRGIIAQILVQKYTELGQSGWQTTPAEVERDVKDLLGGASPLAPPASWAREACVCRKRPPEHARLVVTWSRALRPGNREEMPCADCESSDLHDHRTTAHGQHLFTIRRLPRGGEASAAGQ